MKVVYPGSGRTRLAEASFSLARSSAFRSSSAALSSLGPSRMVLSSDSSLCFCTPPHHSARLKMQAKTLRLTSCWPCYSTYMGRCECERQHNVRWLTQASSGINDL